MSPLNRKHLAKCKTTALYCAWKGQLFLQEQRVCDLALWSPFSSTIPAQLPAKLEARYVVAVSDLRKKLPEVAFGKNNYANNEVRAQGILFSLYEVEIFNQNEVKVDRLIDSLKEKDLALVRYLNERGILILLASSALIKEKDSVPDEFPCLQALFVVSSPRPTRLTAKDLRCDHRVYESSSQVTLVLPALQYALEEATKDHNQEGVPFGTLVKQHFQEFVMADKNLLPTLTELDRRSVSFDQFLKKPDLEAVSGKCTQSSFSRLQLYLLNPQNYTLEVSAVSACSDSWSLNSSRRCDIGSSSGVSADSAALEGPGQLVEATRFWRSVESMAHSTEGARKSGRTNERTSQHCKRKSSRLLGASARKKWAPLKVLYITESSRKRKKSRKKKLDLSSTSSKTLGPSADSGEPTLKLKNLQYPLRRKRGAEVLSAEFVQKTRHESATKAAPASEGPGSEQKKPRLLNCRKSLDAEKAEKIYKRRTVKKKCIHRNKEEIKSNSHCDENDPSSEISASRDASLALRRDECDSHALNMLADLALSSCDSMLLSNANISRERRHLPRGKLLRKASDHEYHRINQKWKAASLASRNHHRSLLAHVQPEQSAESSSNLRERGRVGSGKKKSMRPHLANSHAALPAESADSSDSSVPSLISSEHSYASLASEPLNKQLPWRKSPSPPNSKNGVKNAKPGLLVGKVLPFRHQQNICHPHKQFRTHLPFSRSAVMSARLKDDFWKSHKVTFCNQSVRVTCQWEAEYLFSLDSKYTKNSLEKTVIRAVHGPWDETLLDDMEEMKLILHMWVALFYSKPLRSPTARKVVEHSNPAKFVSLNSVVDPLELIDDSEEPCDLEKCPADLFSEGYRMPSEGEGKTGSPEEKPVSCNELSSTTCIEYEAPLVDPAATGHLDLKDGAGNLGNSLAGLASAFDKVPGEEPEEEFFLGPVISVHSESSSSLNGQGPRPDIEAEVNEAVDSVDVSQTDSACALAELLETTTDTQAVADPRSANSTEELEINNAVSCAKEKLSSQTSSTELLRTSRTTWLEANAEYRKDERRGDSQDLPIDEDEEDVDGESMELVSIDLALSDSNDADVEPRDVDLDQDSEELPQEGGVSEETCVCDVASSGDSLTTVIPLPTAASLHQTAPGIETGSPRDQEDCASKPAPKSAFVEGFFRLQDTERDSLADSGPLQSIPFHQVTPDEVTELARIGDSVLSPKLPISPNQTDLVEQSCDSQEDEGIYLVDSVTLQAIELKQTKNVLVTQEESVGDQEGFLVLGKSQMFSSSSDLVGVSEGGKEINLVDSALQQIDPVHQSIPDEMPELPGNQEVSTKCSISPNQMNLAEAVSREDVPLDELACKVCQVENNILTEEENQNNSLVSARNLAPVKLDDPVGDSCVSQETEGINLSDSALLQNHSDHQITPDEGAKLLVDQDDSVASAQNLAFPDQIGLDAGSWTDQGEEGTKVADTAPLAAGHPAVQEEQKTEQMTDKETQCLELDDGELGTNSGGTKIPVKNENNGNFSVTEEIACDDKLNQLAATVSEEIKSFLCELIDSVSGLEVESEGTPSKEHSGLNWISSVTLECVTPPESDEESLATDQLITSDPRLVVEKYLEQHSVFVSQGRESQEYGQCFSASPKGLISHPVPVVEGEPFRVNEAALDVLSIPCGTDQAKMGTPGLDCRLAETAVSSKNNDLTAPVLCGEGYAGPAGQEASSLAKEGPLRDGTVEILPGVPGGCLVEYPPEESDSPLHRGTSEGQRQAASEDGDDMQLSSVVGPNTHWEVKSLSAGGDQEHFGDPYCRNLSVNASTRSGNSTGVSGANYICDPQSEEEISKSDDWIYLGGKKRIVDVEPEAEHDAWPFACRRDHRAALSSLEAGGEHRPLKGYINFSVTKKHKDRTRTFHPSKRGDSFMEESGLINSLSRTWQVLEDPTQSTLDMECLRFHYKLKQILKNKRPQPSTSGELFVKELASQVIVETLPLRKVPEAPVLNMPPRSRSPLLITIVNPGSRQSAGHRYPRISRHYDSFDPPPPAQDSFSKAARFKSQGQECLAPFHLNKLTYNNKLKDCRGDISVIMDEFAELSRVMKLNDRQMSDKGRAPNTTSEDVPEKSGPLWPRRMGAYGHLFDDLCNTLHFRLKHVAKEAYKKPYSFYLVETDDDPFFGRIKSLLKKGDHVEADPQHFCKTSCPETDRLVVIIRNEDIFLHIHKVPSLLHLKHCPNVTFAGVDCPEDILSSTYQELFHSGGFVVTDDRVLETMTTGELKDMVKTLEQLNGQRKWRWLLHYKETKKLREDARVDSAAHSKDSILRSCQGASFTEVLHYHRCDSRSSPKSEYLNCLLNLQVQHISARLAVFLTEKPSASREALESKGILVLDVNTFVATAQDSAMPCRSSYW